MGYCSYANTLVQLQCLLDISPPAGRPTEAEPSDSSNGGRSGEDHEHHAASPAAAAGSNGQHLIGTLQAYLPEACDACDGHAENLADHLHAFQRAFVLSPACDEQADRETLLCLNERQA